MDCDSNSAAMASSELLIPESVNERGPLNAAMLTVRSCRAIRVRASSALIPTASMVPPEGAHSSMKRPRRTMTFAACSKLRMPATQAAAISPTLWPMTAAGCTPQDFHSAASPICTAKIAGCEISVRSICEPPSGRDSSSMSENFAHGCIAASHASIISLNTGSCRMRSRPIPHHCVPCPLITNATRVACSVRGVKAVRSFGPACPVENALSSCTISVISGETSVRR